MESQAQRGLGWRARRAAVDGREDLRTTLRLLSTRGELQRVLLAEGQSALGDAAAYVALLLIAYSRLHSPWALSAVLLADRAPQLLLAPLAGVLADRMSRRSLLIAADLWRAAALVGLALIPTFGATVALAAVLGCGTAVYRPVAEASLPVLTSDPRDAAVAVTGRWTIIFLGDLLGWALAGSILLVASPATVLLLDAATFAVSIVVLTHTTFDRPVPPATAREPREGVFAMLRGGARATRELHVSVLLLTVISATLAGALISVGEPLLAKNVLGSGDVGFAALVATFGIGLVLGTGMSGPRRGEVPTLQRSYFRAQAIGALGIAIMAASPVLAVAMLGAAIAGAGNGLEVARVLQLIQLTVPEKFIGRINGLVHAGEAGAYLAAFVVGGATAALLGVRQTFALSALGLLITAIAGYLRIRRINRKIKQPLTASRSAEG